MSHSDAHNRLAHASTPEGIRLWLRYAREREAELNFSAGQPDAMTRSRALVEMSSALRDSLEEVRILGDQLALIADELRERSERLVARREGAPAVGWQRANGAEPGSNGSG